MNNNIDFMNDSVNIPEIVAQPYIPPAITILPNEKKSIFKKCLGLFTSLMLLTFVVVVMITLTHLYLNGLFNKTLHLNISVPYSIIFECSIGIVAIMFLLSCYCLFIYK